MGKSSKTLNGICVNLKLKDVNLKFTNIDQHDHAQIAKAKKMLQS